MAQRHKRVCLLCCTWRTIQFPLEDGPFERDPLNQNT